MSDARIRALLEGTADGLYAWLEDHPVSVVGPLIDEIGDSMTRWLDANREEIVEAIARSNRRTGLDSASEEEAVDA